MNTENLRLAFTKSKDITLSFLGGMLSNTRVEPIREDEGVMGIKASWIGNQRESSIAVDTGEMNAKVKMETDEPPTLEYVQQGESRSVSIKNINNITCSMDSETLDEFVSPRGAAIAVCVGAAAGLVGWFIVSVMRAIAVKTNEQNASTPAAIPTQEDVTTDDTPADEE